MWLHGFRAATFFDKRHHFPGKTKHQPINLKEVSMYDLLVKLMAIAALAQFGLTLSHVESCHSRACIQTLEKHSRDVLNVDWKPLTVFPEEAKRFR
jgi:hypothetical protein